MTSRRSVLAGLVGVGAVAVGGCARTTGPSVRPAAGGVVGGPVPSASADPVAVRAVLPAPVRLGVVVSLASAAGEGQEWATGAEGAHVAAHRLARGGAQVELVAANDKGTATGIAAAVDELARQGVAGIVVASTGPHVAAAAAAAAAHGLALVCCHPVPGELLRDGVWCTAPLVEQCGAALAAAAAPGAVLVDAGGGSPSGLRPARVLQAGVTGLDARSARGLTGVPDVLVTGGARALAATVVQLQAASFAGRVLLGPAAMSSGFTSALLDAQASLGANLATAGLAVDDPSAMSASSQGRAVTNFLAAVRSTAGAGTRTFFDQAAFEKVAWAADAASHDAVVVLAGAAAMAASTDPRRVAGALSRLRLGHDDGLVARSLDLTRTGAGPLGRAAVDDRDVVLLHSTDQDPGLRPPPPSGNPTLHWFADDVP